LLAASNTYAETNIECTGTENGKYINSIDTYRAGAGAAWYSIVDLEGTTYKAFNLSTETAYSLMSSSEMGTILHTHLLFALSRHSKVVLEDDTLRNCLYGFTQVRVLN
jgi:hypothetical protein